MGNITKDQSKKSVTIVHPVAGTIFINEHLFNVVSEPLSDTEEITEPGFGGGRTQKNKIDKARKISVEVAVGSLSELYLRRLKRFKNIKFITTWLDSSSSILESQGGTGRECSIKDVPNDRNADTITFEIMSMDYSGD